MLEFFIVIFLLLLLMLLLLLLLLLFFYLLLLLRNFGHGVANVVGLLFVLLNELLQGPLGLFLLRLENTSNLFHFQSNLLSIWWLGLLHRQCISTTSMTR